MSVALSIVTDSRLDKDIACALAFVGQEHGRKIDGETLAIIQSSNIWKSSYDGTFMARWAHEIRVHKKGPPASWVDSARSAARQCPDSDLILAAIDEEVRRVKAEPLKPETPTATLADALSVLGEMRWLWEGWIPAGALTLLVGPGEVGKTRVAVDLARRLWYGDDMPDGSANPHPQGTRTLWIFPDRNLSETAAVMASFGLPAESVLLNSGNDDPLHTEDWDAPNSMDGLVRRVHSEKPGLIVIDTLSYASRRNLCKLDEARAALDPIMDAALKTGVAVLGLFHVNKEGRALGVRVTERARCVLSLTGDTSTDRRRLEIVKCAGLKPSPLGITFHDSGCDFDDNPDSGMDRTPLKRGPKPLKTSEFAEWLHHHLLQGPKAVYELVDLARADGLLAPITPENLHPSITSLYNASKLLPTMFGSTIQETSEIREGTQRAIRIWSI